MQMECKTIKAMDVSIIDNASIMNKNNKVEIWW